MSTNHPNSPLAFPAVTNDKGESFAERRRDSESGMPFVVVQQTGMTLLDYFAAKAMQSHIGLLTVGQFRDEAERYGNGNAPVGLAKVSYGMAQAMLDERQRRIEEANKNMITERRR